MADISYTRTFQHKDWIDNEDVVQAGTENGFNIKFHALENEFDTISTVFGAVNTAIQNIQRVNFLQAQAPITLAANTASSEFPVEVYDRSTLPPNVERVYFPVIVFLSGSTRIFYTVLYRQKAGNQIAVSIQFLNADPASQAQFAFRVLSLAAQSS